MLVFDWVISCVVRRFKCKSLAPGKDHLEEESAVLPILVLHVPLLWLHTDNPSLAVLLDPLHDHTCPADLALLGHEFYLLVLDELILDPLHSLVHIDVEDSLELALLHLRSDFLWGFRHSFRNNIKTLGLNKNYPSSQDSSGLP